MSKDPVVDAIVAARVSLLFNQPFFGNLATRLQLVDASKWCKTAAVDGRHLFYNREFIKALTPEELLFLIGHEVLHCVYDHLGRKGGRNHKLWNIANDYIVNATLVDRKLGKMPQGGLLDSKYNQEMSSEEVYRLLEDDPNFNADNYDTLDEHLALDGSDGKDGKDGADVNYDNRGKNPDGDPDPGSETGVDYSKLPPVYSEEDLAKIRNEVRAALINAVQSNVGNIPAGVLRMVEEMVEPTINWRELLTECIQSTFKEDYSFQLPSKRSWATGLAGSMGGSRVILPSQKQGKTIDICVSLDTSGSISDAIFTAFLSEVVGIIEQYDDYRLHVWCIDAAIYNPMTFTPDNVQDLMAYKPAGGGGNDFPLNWSYMRENEIEPEMFVVFSDGYPCGSWGDPDYCPTIFVIRNEWDKKIEAPFGLTVYMDDQLDE